jgi:hypothetical protein
MVIDEERLVLCVLVVMFALACSNTVSWTAFFITFGVLFILF